MDCIVVRSKELDMTDGLTFNYSLKNKPMEDNILIFRKKK